ncbi:MAG: hypothetical protein LUH03_08370 [Oscillospiraceae bacterium]|nr:hypothetical protein [Oscillospiraceae bacterium]
MKKNSLRGYLIIAVLLVVFSAIAFLPPFSRTAVFAAAYCFGLLAILSQIYFFHASFSGNESAKSKFYGVPIAQIGLVYIVVQLIISLLEMVLASVLPLWVALVVNIIAAGVAFAGCIAADTMREEIIRQDNAIKKDVSAMRELQSLANAIVSQCSNDGMMGDLKRVSEELRFSDPVTSEDSAPLEKELQEQLKELQKAVADDDVETVSALCKRLLAGLTERNRVCKLGK